MKKILIPVLILCIGIIACQKDEIENDAGFISLVESDIDYTTRSCFQLSDGSYVICGSNVIWPAGNPNFGNVHSIIAKFSTTGDLLWKKNLPITMYDLWKGITLPGGGFILAGLDNMPENTNISIAEFNNDGGLIKSSQVLNLTRSGSTSRNTIDFSRLSNGNIAMVMTGISPGIAGSSPRLIIFDTDLNIISDKVFPSMFSATKNYKNMKVVEGNNGMLYVSGMTQEFNAWSWSFLMGIDRSTLNTDFFTEKLGGDTNSYPSPFIVSDAGHVIIPTAVQYKAGIYFDISNYFYYHLDEYFSIGTTVSTIETDAAGNFIARHNYSGFTGFASLMNITKTKDGGYLLVGTCDIRTDAIIYSPFQILLIKTNSQLEQQWVKQINTTYPAIGVDVKCTSDGGFLIGAFEKSFSKNYKMLLIKTDANGSMQ